MAWGFGTGGNRRFFRSRALYRATASGDPIGNPAGLRYLAKPSTAAFLCISLRCRPGLSIPACFPIDLFSGFLLRFVRSPMSLTPYCTTVDGRPRLIDISSRSHLISSHPLSSPSLLILILYLPTSYAKSDRQQFPSQTMRLRRQVSTGANIKQHGRTIAIAMPRRSGDQLVK